MNYSFSQLQRAYPTEEHRKFFEEVLQGDWPKLVDKDAYKNTCALRLSIALNTAGAAFPDGLWRSDGRHATGSGDRVLVKVTSMLSFLKDELGDPWGMSKKAGDAFDFRQVLPKWSGVLVYRFPVGASAATGHIDLWDGAICYWSCPPLDVDAAYDVMLWAIP